MNLESPDDTGGLWGSILRSLGYRVWAFMRLPDGRYCYVPYETIGKTDRVIKEVEAEGGTFLKWRLWKP